VKFAQLNRRGFHRVNYAETYPPLKSSDAGLPWAVFHGVNISQGKQPKGLLVTFTRFTKYVKSVFPAESRA